MAAGSFDLEQKREWRQKKMAAFYIQSGISKMTRMSPQLK